MEKYSMNVNYLFLVVIYMEYYLGIKEEKEEKGERGLLFLKILKVNFIV